ncbi:Protein transport protein like [Actinidia chinensis var. chinensis]|uniref:Protein transport protein like n=1 Tax=Actinidia chinensis var. chinensis TaxID=1590841 RepID=A0A2R6Q913_ACTCC|nr:Protein transport protein like [Actinidia chinensis var. chinensis]
MTTQAGSLIRDQNLNVHSDVAPLGLKSNGSKAQKHGAVGGRRALNDISNSGRPLALQTSKNHNSKNVIPVGEEIGPSKLILGGKTKNISKAPEKVHRKALSDLANSGKPHLHQASKKNHGKKLGAVVEEQILPHAVAEEQFLHNHESCIKAQAKAVDMDYFLKTIGLDNGNSMQLASPWVSPLPKKLKSERPSRYSEMEAVSELLYEDRSRWKKTDLHSELTPCGTLKSPKPSYLLWKKCNSPKFTLTETPKLPKR